MTGQDVMQAIRDYDIAFYTGLACGFIVGLIVDSICRHSRTKK